MLVVVVRPFDEVTGEGDVEPLDIAFDYQKVIDQLNLKLEMAKKTLGITSDSVFVQWHDEELKYLKNMQNMTEPIEEQLAVEYVEVLKRLKKEKYVE